MILTEQSVLLFYLPAAILIFHGLRRWVSVDLGYGVIVAFSLAGIAAFGLQALALALICTAVGYGGWAGLQKLTSLAARQALLCILAAILIGLLGVSKYLPALQGDIARVVVPFGLAIISVQQFSVLLTAYCQAAPLPSLLHFARQSLFFPALFAGPIIRPQTWSSPPEDPSDWDDRLARGVGAFAFGLAKVTILGEAALRFVQPLMTEAAFTPLPLLPCVLLILGAALTAYFFISGYCDMAFGTGAMVGLKLPAHVDAPFRPSATRKIWRHWSITLHDVLSDVFASSKTAGSKQHLGLLLLAMAVSLLWHADANVIGPLVLIVAGGTVLRVAANKLPARLAAMGVYIVTAVSGILALSILTLGSAEPMVNALSGLGTGQLGLRDIFVHDSQFIWQLVLIIVMLLWLPVEISVHALFDPEAGPETRRIFGLQVPAWSLSAPWVCLVTALLVAGVLQAGTVRDTIYFGF